VHLDAQNGTAVGEPLEGHTGWVWSVAFSPDGKHIVSGSSDHTLRIWDTQSGTAVGESLEGHTGSVQSVAFSSDGKHIVSGSDDHTVQIWKANQITVIHPNNNIPVCSIPHTFHFFA
jgi:WD40 repeat protein